MLLELGLPKMRSVGLSGRHGSGSSQGGPVRFEFVSGSSSGRQWAEDLGRKMKHHVEIKFLSISCGCVWAKKSEVGPGLKLSKGRKASVLALTGNAAASGERSDVKQPGNAARVFHRLAHTLHTISKVPEGL